MLFRIRAGDLHFHDVRRDSIRDTDPSIPGNLKRIHGICYHASTEAEVVLGDRVADAIAHIVKRFTDLTGISDGLLNRVDATALTLF